MDPKELLTRKIGPLPTWGWAVAIGGGALAVKLMRGGGGRETLVVPTGAPPVSPGFADEFDEGLGEVRNRLDALEQPTNNNTSGRNEPGPIVGFPNMPAGFDLVTWIRGLRRKFPRIARRAVQQARPNETPRQRQTRLLRELGAYGVAGGSFNPGIFVRGLRMRYPNVAALFTERGFEGETAEQRTARLWREIAFFGQWGKTQIQPPPVTPPAQQPAPTP